MFYYNQVTTSIEAGITSEEYTNKETLKRNHTFASLVLYVVAESKYVLCSLLD